MTAALRLCLVLLPLSASLACGGLDHDATPDANALLCDRDPPLTYESFGDGFMTQNCTPCHHSLLPMAERNGAPLGVDLDTYSGVLSWAERISARTLESQTMPPGGGLAQSDLDQLEEWLSCQVSQDLQTLEDNSGGEVQP